MSTFSADTIYLPIFVRFLKNQRHKMEIDKWCEGIRLCKDPGEEYNIDWVNQNGAWFHDAWYNSICKNCINWGYCGWKVKQCCNLFKILNK